MQTQRIPPPYAHRAIKKTSKRVVNKEVHFRIYQFIPFLSDKKIKSVRQTEAHSKSNKPNRNKQNQSVFLRNISNDALFDFDL